MIVHRVLVNFGVVKNLIAADVPFAGKPHVEPFVENTMLGELIIQVVLRGHLVSSVLRLNFVHGVDVVGITSRCAESSDTVLCDTFSCLGLL